jgi:hypothetical protein
MIILLTLKRKGLLGRNPQILQYGSDNIIFRSLAYTRSKSTRRALRPLFLFPFPPRVPAARLYFEAR